MKETQTVAVAPSKKPPKLFINDSLHLYKGFSNKTYDKARIRKTWIFLISKYNKYKSLDQSGKLQNAIPSVK